MSTVQNIPLTPQVLLQVLQAASSTEHVQSASAQLRLWERADHNLWSLLQDAYLDRSLAVEIRWIAVLQLKNGVDKYWRKNALNAIPKSEKERIRGRLLSSVDEPIPQLAVQNAVIIAKISRLDYPLEWPGIFNELTTIIRICSESSPDPTTLNNDSILKLSRALQILLYVVKEQASGKLQRTRTNLQTVTPEMFKVLGGVYIKFVNIWTSSPSPEPELMAITLFCIKIQRRLIVSGYEFPNRVEEVKQLWQILQTHLGSFIPLTEGTGLLVEAARRHVKSLGKFFWNVNTSHQTSFVLMPNTIGLVRAYWSLVVTHGERLASSKPLGGKRKAMANGTNGLAEAAAEGGKEDEKLQEFQEKVALQGMLLLRGCIRMVFNPTATYAKSRSPQEREEQKHAVDLLKAELFTPDTVIHCMEVLVTKYFMLRRGDIEGWEEDPEGWTTQWEDSSDSWEFMIRPCAEKLFLDLVVNFKAILVDPLKRVFESVSTLENQDILFKDAVYTAIGLAGSVLAPVVNFEPFLNNTLVQEVQISAPWYNILRRRIATLIGQWVPINIAVESRPTIYKISQHLLNKSDPLNDLVVRLTTARELRKSVDEWDFKEEDFLPFAHSLLESLLDLIDEVDSTEMQMSILGVIGCVVDRLEHRIEPYAERIINIIPPLWAQTGEHHLFKQSILVVLTQLINALKAESVKYHSLILPLLRYSIDPATGMQVFLLDEALDLWEATIKNMPAPAPPEVLSLVPILLPLVEHGGPSLRNVLEIIEGYVLLAPTEMITQYREPMFNQFTSLIQGHCKSEIHVIVTNIIEIIFRMAGDNEDAAQEIAKCLLDSGFLSLACMQIYHTWAAEQTTGPKKQYAPVDSKIITDYFNVLARIALSSTKVFVGAMEYIGQKRGGERLEQTIKWMLEEWFSHFCNLAFPKTRKLHTLALTKLLETNQKWILIKLQDLITVWTDIVNEVQNDQSNENLIYWPKVSSSDADGSEARTPQMHRQHELAKADPVFTVNVTEWIRHYFQKAQRENGGMELFNEEWLENVDKNVLADFAKVIVI